MTASKPQETATVGVTEHGNSAVLVTLAADRDLLDRRRVDLTAKGLPTHPHHHEGSWAVGRYTDSPWARKVSLDEAIALIKQVEEASAEGAQACLRALANDLSTPVGGIALRRCPELPPTIEECIADNRAQAIADTVMYRKAITAAAMDRDWAVFWYDKDTVFHQAAAILGCADIKLVLKDLGRSVGPPWQAKHKLAAAAAIVANHDS